jgi:hypothetical protein
MHTNNPVTDFIYIGNASEVRIDANLKLRYAPNKYNALMVALTKEHKAHLEQDDTVTFLSVKRDKLIECRYHEYKVWCSKQPEDPDALIKRVAMFKPDLLHLNMRIKTTILRRAVDLCLLEPPRRKQGGETNRAALNRRIEEVNMVLNELASADKSQSGSIKLVNYVCLYSSLCIYLTHFVYFVRLEIEGEGTRVQLKGLTIGNDRIDKIFASFQSVLDVMIKEDERFDNAQCQFGTIYRQITDLVERLQSILSRLRQKDIFDAKDCLVLQNDIDVVSVNDTVE